VIGYIKNEKVAAEAVAAQAGLTADFILAWGAYESAYGKPNASQKSNNYFGLRPARSSFGRQ
jgi:flagellum-specific peptidoglycan hydrolase FlgJ